MTTKRTRRAHGRIAEFDDAMRLHLESGDCLLAGAGKGCGCGLVGPDGVFRDGLARAARAHFNLPGGTHAD